MTPPTRQASPADRRCQLDPTAVDALAAQLHALRCVPVFRPPLPRPEADPAHADTDRAAARFVLLGLRDAGLHLAPTGAPR